MRTLLFFLFFAPFSLLAAQSAQHPGLEAITKAIGSGDVDALSKYFDETLDVSILDNEKTYSKAQAAEAVKTFFANNKPRSFNAMHNGTSRGSSDQYCIGNMTAANGSYRVYIYLKINGNAATIKELRFDKE